jgi:DNA-binding CsgD family transcriptional regulator
MSVSVLLVGRRAEQTVVSEFARAGAPARALVISGEPGIGKTELWRFACDEAAADGYTVLRATAVASEATLPYAALGDLLARATLGDLEPVHREALGAVSLDGTGSTDVRLVAGGFLRYLLAASGRAPVVVAVDDVQWIDPASATVLGFALRRLDGEAVRTVVSVRSGREVPLQLSDERTDAIELGALSRGALHHLLNERLGLSLRRPLAQRVYSLSGGNPFYALELARELIRKPGLPQETGVGLPASLKGVVDARIAALPTSCVAALRVAALAEAPTLALVDDVVEGGASALDAAFADEVVMLEGRRVRFVHPLYAEGVVAAIAPSELRALHARLADAVDGGPARARHRARAATGPDEPTALLLETAALDELANGSAALSAALAGDALGLSEGRPPPERVFLAARACLSAGELDRARSLLLEHLGGMAQGDERSRAFLLLARSVGTNRELLEFTTSAVEEARAPAFRADALVYLATVNAFGFLREIPSQVRLVLEAAELLEREEALLDIAASDALTIFAMAGLPEREFDLGSSEPATFFNSLERSRGLALLWRGELSDARPVFEAGLAQARETAEDESITSALLQLAELEARAGRVAEASRLAESAALGAWDGEARAMAPRIRAAAGLAAREPDLTVALAGEAVELARQGEYVWQEFEARRIAGSACLLGGDAASALGWLEPVHEHLARNGVRNPGVFPVTGDLAEAHLRSGDTGSAERLLEELDVAGREQHHPWASSVAERVRGLLADVDGDYTTAEEAFSAAAERASRHGLELDAARAQLALGVARRHAKHRAEARAALAEAEASFARLGASRYVEQTQAEAARVAGRRRTGNELTETEARVAEFVAAGKTNREVAAALSLSVRGVEANLSRVYLKLGLRSRTELAAARTPGTGSKSVDSHISTEPPAP